MNETLISPEMSTAEIQSALDQAQPGQTLLFTPGVYRGAWTMNASGTEDAPIVLAAQTPGTVILTGADPVEGWTPGEQGTWWVDIDLEHLEPATKYGFLAGRREQVFVDGQPLQQVLAPEDVGPGRFHYAAKRLTICPQPFTGELRGGEVDIDAGAITGGGVQTVDRESPANNWQFLLRPFDPPNHTIEVTTRCNIFVMGDRRHHDSPANIVLRGLTFRGSGDAPQSAMAQLAGRNLLIEECLFEYGAARGFDLRTEHSVIRKCVTRLNGQMGFSGFGDHNLMEDCALLYNNTKHSAFWCFEMGGCKICRTGHWTVRRVRCVGNDGPGIWFDIDNHHAVIEQCWCERNSGPGIMYEISHDAEIRNNVCVANGIAARKDVRLDSLLTSVSKDQPVYGQGILVQMSRRVRVLHNTCVGNLRCGIELRHHSYQQAGMEGHSPERYKLEDNVVLNNLLADNGVDNLAVTVQPRNPLKMDEVQSNRHDYNLVHRSDALVALRGELTEYARWGKTQMSGTMSLEEWRSSTQQDLHSIQWEPYFVAPEQGDYRIEEISPANGTATSEGQVAEDFNGRPRPSAAAIGAFESAPATAALLLGVRL